jgi:lipopolysaccharide biosynthesis glycosyltransferase
MQATVNDGSSAGEDPIVVVFTADDGYAMPLAAAARSLIDNAGPARAIHLHVIDSGLSAANRERLAASWDLGRARIDWWDAPLSRVEHLPVWGLGRTVYYRLLIDEVLPPEVERAIYLDSDVLVLGDLGPLFDSDL